MWQPPGTRAPQHTWNFDFSKGWLPPGSDVEQNNLQYSMPPGQFPGAIDAPDWSLLVSPPGVQAPSHAINYTPTTGEITPQGQQAPADQLNLSMMPQKDYTDTPSTALGALRATSQQPESPTAMAQKMLQMIGLGPALGMGQAVGVGAGDPTPTSGDPYASPFGPAESNYNGSAATASAPPPSSGQPVGGTGTDPLSTAQGLGLGTTPGSTGTGAPKTTVLPKGAQGYFVTMPDGSTQWVSADPSQQTQAAPAPDHWTIIGNQKINTATGSTEAIPGYESPYAMRTPAETVTDKTTGTTYVLDPHTGQVINTLQGTPDAQALGGGAYMVYDPSTGQYVTHMGPQPPHETVTGDNRIISYDPTTQSAKQVGQFAETKVMPDGSVETINPDGTVSWAYQAPQFHQMPDGSIAEYDPTTKQWSTPYTPAYLNQAPPAWWEEHMHKEYPNLYPAPAPVTNWNQVSGRDFATGKGQDVGVGATPALPGPMPMQPAYSPFAPNPDPSTELTNPWLSPTAVGGMGPQIPMPQPAFNTTAPSGMFGMGQDFGIGADYDQPLTGLGGDYDQPLTGVGAETPPLHPGDVVGSGHHFGEPVSMEGVHKGTDLQAYRGTPVVSPAHGVVHSVEYDPAGLGLQLHIQGHDGQLHTLAHLADVHVQQGQPVAAGDHVATVGSTGAGSTGPHLDYRIQDQQGNYLNPEPSLGYLSQLPRADDGSEPGVGGGPTDPVPPLLPGNPFPMGAGQQWLMDAETGAAGGERVYGGQIFPRRIFRPFYPDDMQGLPGSGQDVGVGDANNPFLDSTIPIATPQVQSPMSPGVPSASAGAPSAQTPPTPNLADQYAQPQMYAGSNSLLQSNQGPGLGQYDPYMLNPYMGQGPMPGQQTQGQQSNPMQPPGQSSSSSTNSDTFGSSGDTSLYTPTGYPEPYSYTPGGAPYGAQTQLGIGQDFGVGAGNPYDYTGGYGVAPSSDMSGNANTGGGATQPTTQASGVAADQTQQQLDMNQSYLTSLQQQMQAQQAYNNSLLQAQLMQIGQAYQFHGDAQRAQQEALIAENQWRSQDRQLQMQMTQLNLWGQAMLNEAYNNPWLTSLAGMTPGYGQPGGPGYMGEQPYGRLGPPGSTYNPNTGGNLYNPMDLQQQLNSLFGPPPNPGSDPNNLWGRGRTDLSTWNTPGSNPVQGSVSLPTGGNNQPGSNGSPSLGTTGTTTSPMGTPAPSGPQTNTPSFGTNQPASNPGGPAPGQASGNQVQAPGTTNTGNSGARTSPNGMQIPGPSQQAQPLGQTMGPGPYGSSTGNQGITVGGQGTGGPIVGHTAYGNPIYSPQAALNASPFQRAAVRTDVALTGEPWSHYSYSTRDLWGTAGGPTQPLQTTQMQAAHQTPLEQIGTNQMADFMGQSPQEYWTLQQRQWEPAQQSSVYQKA